MSDTATRKPRQRRSPPADNVSVSARIPRKMLAVMEGISRVTGQTVNDLAAMAIDNYLHARGAYEPYQQATPADVQALTEMARTVATPPPTPDVPPPLPSPLDLPEADEE